MRFNVVNEESVLSNLESHFIKKRDSFFIYKCGDLLGLNVLEEKLGQIHTSGEGEGRRSAALVLDFANQNGLHLLKESKSYLFINVVIF